MYSFTKILKVIVLLVIIFSLYSVTISGSSPPPPPPPCSTQSAGCYKIPDTKANFGELAITEFDYFLPENKCKSSGGCDCRGIPDNIVEQRDPDESSGACACISATDWNAIGRCCGDDIDDCGKISSGVLCNINVHASSANWVGAEPNIGDIRYVGCAGVEYLSDGLNWIVCNDTFWKQTVSDSEYICVGAGRESIIECCGEGSCNSRIDGKTLKTGESIEGDSKVYYCRTDKKFVTNLDVPISGTGDTSLINKNRITCERAGLKWTGTKCCSEADDTNEYYNDINGIGGCWNGEPVISIDFVEGTNESITNYKGAFNGCAIEKSNYNKDNDDLLNLADIHTGGQLIVNHAYCFTDTQNEFFCSYTEKWLPTDGDDRSHLSFSPLNDSEQKAECCAKDECWNGDECVANQAASPLSQPIGDGYRCVNGEWTQSQPKLTCDDSAAGFCPEQSQCLVNALAASGKQCAETGQYIDDCLCEEGIWSSRTKLLALKLLKLKDGDFTLFCGTRENALNNLKYLTESNQIVADVLKNIQTNNFCILKSDSKVIGATSINKNLEDLPSNSLNIFGVTSCNNALIDDGKYHACDSTNKVWFNKKLKSFIYSTNAITVPSEQESESFIGNIMKDIIDSIKRLIGQGPFDDSYIRGIKKFDKLYIAQQEGKTIQGSIEGKNFKNAIIEYSGFETDICNFVDKFNQAKKDVSSGISCKKEDNKYYVLAQGSQFTSLNPESIWSDLTSKLRLK